MEAKDFDLSKFGDGIIVVKKDGETYSATHEALLRPGVLSVLQGDLERVDRELQKEADEMWKEE